MVLILSITFNQIGLSFLACFALRELMILILPDRLAGPQGSFICTGSERV